MVLLSEGSSVKESPEDKQASAPCVRGSTFTWGPIFSVKSGPVPGFSGGGGVRIFCYTGTGTVNWTNAIGDNGSGSCHCLRPV